MDHMTIRLIIGALLVVAVVALAGKRALTLFKLITSGQPTVDRPESRPAALESPASGVRIASRSMRGQPVRTRTPGPLDMGRFERTKDSNFISMGPERGLSAGAVQNRSSFLVSWALTTVRI